MVILLSMAWAVIGLPSPNFRVSAGIMAIYYIIPGEFVFTGLDYWTGLLDWTTGLAFHYNVGYQNKGGVNKMQPNKCSMLS